MHATRLVIALVLGLIGLAWIGQGSGLIPGSVMSGSTFWLLVGIVLLVVAVGIVLFDRRRPTAHG